MYFMKDNEITNSKGVIKMTVYDFMAKFGFYEQFYIFVDGKDITNDTPVYLAQIKRHECNNENVLDALELKAIKYDIEQNIIYAER